MSQKRMTSDEVMAAREAMENLPENVTPMNLPDPCPTGEGLPFADPEWDENDAPAPEAPLTDEDVQNFLEEEGGPDAEPEAPAKRVECPCCGNQILADSPEDALEICTCSGAKVLRQESEMNDKIETHFGPASKLRFGTEHTPEEIMIMKLLASYVAKRKIKAITITLNDNDKAVFLIKKDATIVRHTRAIKAESEV